MQAFYDVNRHIYFYMEQRVMNFVGRSSVHVISCIYHFLNICISSTEDIDIADQIHLIVQLGYRKFPFWLLCIKEIILPSTNCNSARAGIHIEFAGYDFSHSFTSMVICIFLYQRIYHLVVFPAIYETCGKRSFTPNP